MPDFSIEDTAVADGHRVVCGIDEAGRGPWAGPVVAAAVVLDREAMPPSLCAALDDSKKLKPVRRAELLDRLSGCARIAVGHAPVEEIDRINILQATMAAMARAVAALDVRPDVALVDGNRAPALDCPARPVVRGDGLSLSIAAASIAAKVARDALMADLARAHRGYGWERNAGYGTAEHRQAIEALGLTPHHRRSFAPIRNILSLSEETTVTS